MKKMELDISTKLGILQKHTLMKINDELGENFQFGQILWVDEWVRNPNNKWKQERVDRAIKILDKYIERKKNL